MNRQAAKQASPQFLWLAASAAVVIGFAAFSSGSVGSNSLRQTTIVQAIGGDPERAVPAMIRNGCGGCHEIPGVPGAHGTVGPSLQGVVERGYIGASRATPDAMMRWISRARDVDPKTAMPNTNLSPQEARDITAYLYART